MRPNQLLGGRYRLEQRIGTGGMGEVWRARDTMLERVVAVKALHPAMADDPDHRERFLREARTVAALNAPGIVAMYDTAEETGSDGAVLSYSVMEFVVGRPLSDHITGPESLPPAEVMRLMAQVAHGLDAAHHLGIIHRDVKPANILINSFGDATLVDFGIARRPGETALTTSGAVMGTTEYASPEQLRDEELTAASDVYSLGTVAYECLAGVRPFEGSTVAAVIAGHLNRTPPPLPASVPAPIAQVVLRALAKVPADRFGSAAEFARACGRAARERVHAPPVVAVPTATRRLPAATEASGRAAHAVPEAAPGTTEQPARRRRRVPRALAVIGAVALLAVLATGAVFLFTQDTAADDKSPGPGDSASDAGPTGSLPAELAASVLVSEDNKLCLLSRELDGAKAAVKARMGLCQDAEHPDYDFDPVGGGAVAIRIGSGDGGKACLGVDTEAVSLVADPDCGPDAAWDFEHLRTGDGIEYWRISSHTKDGLCLQAGAEQGDAAYVEHCDDGVPQQWRTESAD